MATQAGRFNISSLTAIARKVAEAGAVAAYPFWGSGLPSREVDHTVSDAVRAEVERCAVRATSAVNEGEKDMADFLPAGTEYGAANMPQPTRLETAQDVLECSQNLITGNPGGSACVFAIAQAEEPDDGKALFYRGIRTFYAEKLFYPKRLIGAGLTLGASISENARRAAKHLGCSTKELRALTLDRPRNKARTEALRELGVQVLEWPHGDLLPIKWLNLHEELPNAPHFLFGSGGTPEGILGAALSKCLGGGGQLRRFETPSHVREVLREQGILEDMVYDIESLVPATELAVAICGVTTIPDILHGVHPLPAGENGKVRYNTHTFFASYNHGATAHNFARAH